MTQEEVANRNILQVLQKIRKNYQQIGGVNFTYKIGELTMSHEDEVAVLQMLDSKKIIEIERSYGNNSSR